MKKFTVLILAGLLLPAFCFGAYSYERTPSGFTIENPVSFEISFDDYDVDTGCVGYDYWAMSLSTGGGVSEDYEPLTFLASTTKNHTWTQFAPMSTPPEADLPVRTYISVDFACSPVEIPTYEDWINGVYIGDNFEVVEGEEEAGFISGINTDFLASTTAYVGETFTDLWTLIALVMGLPLGFWGIKKVIGLVKLR